MKWAISLVAVISGILPCASLFAKTIKVDGSVDLNDAIAAGSTGDTLLLGPGLHVVHQTIDFSRHRAPLDVVKDLTITSTSGPDTTILQLGDLSAPDGPGSVLDFHGGETAASVIEGVTITGGRYRRDQQRGEEGGGIRIRGKAAPTFRHCVITRNGCRDSGGSIFCAGDSTPRFEDCVIFQNGSGGFGGGVGIADRSAPVFELCRTAAPLLRAS